ncbi:Hypothetical predicted protein [Olea europaea subsp. europaea]|uniref:Uncharacterized protein n=1 Tax=Olea europaea subsp. europaea TaxID=158383 RepID=A0A8S0TUJ8_OLEEU|nr:Hypothetical predicted protein [Olea europaea subsp. europaea]
MDIHVPYNPQATQPHQDTSIHIPITANNPENRDVQPIFESVNSRSKKPFFDYDGGAHDRRPPPQNTTHHGASTEHMGLPQFGIEMTVRPETMTCIKIGPIPFQVSSLHDSNLQIASISMQLKVKRCWIWI